MIRVKCDNGEHIAIKEDFFKNSIYDYMNGGKLPSDGYTYEKSNVSIDPKTGKQTVTWEEIDINDIDTKDKLYNYLEIKSNEKGLVDFMTDLSTLWGSPNAVAFKETCLPVGEAVCAFYDEMRMIAQNAVDACNKVAVANGGLLINDIYYDEGMGSTQLFVPELQSSINRNVGMNVE